MLLQSITFRPLVKKKSYTEFQQFRLCVPSTATAQVCTSIDVTGKWALCGICCPEQFGTKKSTLSLNPLIYLTVPGWGSEIQNTEHGSSCLQNCSFEMFYDVRGMFQEEKEFTLLLPLPKCQQCLWCHFYSKRVVWCNCSQQHCSFQEPDLLLPFLPSPEIAQQSTRNKLKTICHTTATRQLMLKVSI